MSDNPYELETTLKGYVIPKGDGAQRADVEITVGPEGIIARSESGQEHLVPWKGIRLGQTPDSVTVQAKDRSVSITSADPEFLRALETAGGNDLNDALSRLAGETVSSSWRHRLGCLAVLAGIGVVLWGIPHLFRGTVHQIVENLPYEVDEQIGKAVWEEMERTSSLGDEVTNEKVREAIQVMIDRLQPHGEILEAEYTFAVVRNDVPNAFALPGGYMVVFTGLIELSDSPEEVCGVIAHEMAHVTKRHGLRRVAHTVGIWAGVAILFGDASTLTSIALNLFTMASVNDYSQDQETEADIEGCEMMIAARIDPRGLALFFKKMKREVGDIPDALAWTSTHPQHDERVEAILAYEAEHGATVEYEPLDLDWDAVKAALDEEDESDDETNEDPSNEDEETASDEDE